MPKYKATGNLDRKAHLIRKIEERKAVLERLAMEDPYYFFKPSGGDITEQGRELLEDYLKPDDIPQVLEGQRDVFGCDADIIAMFGGNQSGKTTAACIMSYIWATGFVPKALEGIVPDAMIPKKFPQHIRVEGVDWKTMLGNILPTWRHWAPRDFLINRSFDSSYSSEERLLRLHKGKELLGTIEFMTNQQSVESHQGPPKHGVIYDEEPKFDIYRENMARFTTADRVKIMFSMTPTRGLSWVHDRIVLKAETEEGHRIRCFKVPSITNKVANLGVIRDILDELSGYEEIKMRLLGEFTSLGGLIYGNLFNPKIHVIKPFEMKYEDFTVYRGLDPHLVKASCCIELAVDREGNEFVVGTYLDVGDTDKIKHDLSMRARDRNYRLGWTICDKSADSNITVFGDRNIYRELKFGKDAIPALFTSEKYTGSIHAGVDQIKKLLKINPLTGKPGLFIFDTEENRVLINAMRTIERNKNLNEEERGIPDKIDEGRHDTHAALRYIHQRPVRWLAPVDYVPEYIPVNKAVGY